MRRYRPTWRPSTRAADIDVDAVIAYCRTAIDQRRDIMLIEGVGGIMVPLDSQRTILDVMMALQVPLILVTGSYLGTISHTLTALDALYRRSMKVMAIIVSETPGSTVPLDETSPPSAASSSRSSACRASGRAGRSGPPPAAFERIFGSERRER